MARSYRRQLQKPPDARLLDAHPTIGDALAAGRFSIDHAHQIARIFQNPRIANLLGTIVDVLVERRDYAEFRGDIDEVIAQLDTSPPPDTPITTKGIEPKRSGSSI